MLECGCQSLSICSEVYPDYAVFGIYEYVELFYGFGIVGYFCF
jgi:hypothetical protein